MRMDWTPPRLAAGSIAVGLAVLALKLLAWRLTGSVALFSDAMESIINVVTAVGAWGAVKVAAKPADANHPYGHHKAEYFAAVLEGVLIVLAALAIAHAAVRALGEARVPALGPVGIGMSLLAGLANDWWCRTLLREGRRLKSPALMADGRHLWTDVVSSAGMLAGLGVVLLTGWWRLDALLGALVAVNIVWSGLRLVRESIAGLMDEALPEGDVARIRAVLARHAEGAMEAHDLRTRQAGGQMFVEFHLVVPGHWTVARAHALCDTLEAELRAALAGAMLISIHVEPEEKAKGRAGALPEVVMAPPARQPQG